MTRWRALGLTGVALSTLALVAWAAWRPTPHDPAVIETSGRIEGDQAAVGAKLGGRIVRLAVREGQRVAGGRTIAELGSEQVRARLAQAEHGVHAARERLEEARARVEVAERRAEAAATAVELAERESRARIGEAEAALGTARARLRQAEADLDNTARDDARSRELFRRELIAAQQADRSRTAWEVARATVDAAGKQAAQAAEAVELARASRVAVEVRRQEARTAAAQVAEARAAVAAAAAEVEAAEAARALARANLADTTVTAPFTGTVLRKLVEPGEVVASGTPLVTLVDLARLYAKVYVAEAELGRVRLGTPARVYTDAFPGRAFDAAVAEVAEQAEFTPRDVHMKDERVKLVFAVKLALRNPDGVLKPGMPVDARIAGGGE
ncbi:MAG: efflux RND transporter periplasmic adaptor subunit [Candidatus Rokubacteria bacterium]|nr:efflux RND transporter periplasmic adaptor subunit [Candidatus Rokubacteria bacterium]